MIIYHNNMKIIIVIIGIFQFLLISAHSPTLYAKQFIHPGLLNNQAELDFIKARVINDDVPWIAGYKRLKKENNYLGHSPHPIANVVANKYRMDSGDRDHLVRDAEVAYGSSLLWYLTGDERYAAKAVEIINAWSMAFLKCTGYDATLAMAYSWTTMIWAAEIIRYTYSGWSYDDIAAFENMLKNKVWSYVEEGADGHNSNWEMWTVCCMISISVFTDDWGKFKQAIKFYKKRLPKAVYKNGKAQETCRDLWHTQMGLAPFAYAAEIAWKQGVDLYANMRSRLMKGIEYNAAVVMGKVDPGCTVKKADRWWPFYELAYNHYHNRKGFECPMMKKAIYLSRPEKYNRTGWGTLTHAALP